MQKQSGTVQSWYKLNDRQDFGSWQLSDDMSMKISFGSSEGRQFINIDGPGVNYYKDD